MGSNMSTIDTDLANSHQQLQAATTKPATTLPATSAPPNRLPPVDSRETVRSQATRVTHWRLVDDSDELYESAAIGRYVPTTELPWGLPTGTSTCTQSHLRLAKPSQITVPSVLGKRTASSEPKPEKKPKLQATPQAIKIAAREFKSCETTEQYLSQQAETESETTDSQGGCETSQAFDGNAGNAFNGNGLDEYKKHSRQAHANAHLGSCLYQDSDHEDEGYWSKVVSPTNIGRELTEEEKEEELNKTLLYLRQTNIKLSPPTASNQGRKCSVQASEGEDELLEQTRQCMLKEHEEGAERSRLLREKALERRRLLELSDSSASSEHSKIFSKKGHEWHPDSDLFSDSDGQTTTAEQLLDITKRYVSEESGSVSPEPCRRSRDSLKYVN